MTVRSSGDESVTHFFGRLRTGDREAAEKLWQTFCPRLLGLARKTLHRRGSGLAEPEDAVQSAFVSFWRRAERGDFSDELDRNSLWSLLAVITVRKVLNQQVREGAKKRGGGRVYNEASMAGNDGKPFHLDEALAGVPTGDFDLECEERLAQLDDELRSIALLRLMGHTNREIAEVQQCTERKIERKLQLIRLTWEKEMEGMAD